MWSKSIEDIVYMKKLQQNELLTKKEAFWKYFWIYVDINVNICTEIFRKIFQFRKFLWILVTKLEEVHHSAAYTQLTFTFSKLTIETLENGVKYVTHRQKQLR